MGSGTGLTDTTVTTMMTTSRPRAKPKVSAMRKVMTLNFLDCTINVSVLNGNKPIVTSIDSNLKKHILPDGVQTLVDIRKEAAIMIIEDLIASHAGNGIDVSAKEYVDGIESAVLGL